MLEGRERAGYYCLHSLLPGSRLAVAFSNEVQSSPVAVASALATAPSGFRVLALPLQALGWSQPLLQLLHLEHSTTLCWLPLNVPLHLIVTSLSSPPVSPPECAVLAGLWWVQVMRAPIWRSQGLGCREDLSQGGHVSLGKLLLLSGISFFIFEVGMI